MRLWRVAETPPTNRAAIMFVEGKRMRPIRIFITAILGASALLRLARGEEPLQVRPAKITLASPEASQQLLATVGRDGRKRDVTRQVQYQAADPRIVRITETGRVLPLREGTTEIRVRRKTTIVQIPVRVQGLKDPAPVSFRREALPILTKAGCNSGGCHGKAEGQNGFRLSVFGFDAVGDHAALVKQGRGRRVFLAAPDRSLLLRKATAEIPHGGGAKLEPGGLWHRRLLRWIAEGAKLDDQTAPQITAIEVEPARLVLSPRSTFSPGSKFVYSRAIFSSKSKKGSRTRSRTAWISSFRSS